MNCINGVNTVITVSKVNTVITTNKVIMVLSHKFRSQLPAERLVQQRFPQLLQRRELALIDRSEAAGF